MPHYFAAPYISGFECRAVNDRDALAQADLLLRTLRECAPVDAAEWGAAFPSSPPREFAGRGLKSKTTYGEDDQILHALESRRLTMALWGVSLDREVASGYGKRFLFQIQGPFRGVPAAMYSGEQEDEDEGSVRRSVCGRGLRSRCRDAAAA
ncbi:MAG: hypothetical protein DYH12_02965 [Sorangiineae bacterium PRO1]|nr:hypothetical protein [Sorangiineae bacterium PRO1]